MPGLPQNMATAYILDSTPNVLSIGKLCVKHGYSFYWPPQSKDPYFVKPDGQIIPLTVIGFIPYLIITNS